MHISYIFLLPSPVVLLLHYFDFIIGFCMGVFVYHIFLYKLFNSKKFKKLKRLGKERNGDKRFDWIKGE